LLFLLSSESRSYDARTVRLRPFFFSVSVPLIFVAYLNMTNSSGNAIPDLLNGYSTTRY